MDKDLKFVASDNARNEVEKLRETLTAQGLSPKEVDSALMEIFLNNAEPVTEEIPIVLEEIELISETVSEPTVIQEEDPGKLEVSYLKQKDGGKIVLSQKMTYPAQPTIKLVPPKPKTDDKKIIDELNKSRRGIPGRPTSVNPFPIEVNPFAKKGISNAGQGDLFGSRQKNSFSADDASGGVDTMKIGPHHQSKMTPIDWGVDVFGLESGQTAKIPKTIPLTSSQPVVLPPELLQALAISGVLELGDEEM
jgi:hypothetical protein